MVLRAKPGEVMWNERDEVSAEEDAFELLESFGKLGALEICAEELERANGPEEISHWIEVKSIVVTEPIEDGEDDSIEHELPDPDQLWLRLS
jgi:hypothetical protein